MKKRVYQAAEYFQKRVSEAVPDAEVEVSVPLEKEDAAFIIYVSKKTQHVLEIISDILIETEEAYGVTLAYTPLMRQTVVAE